MPKKSARFSKAEREQFRTQLPLEIQTALASQNTAVLVAYIESEIDGSNLPPQSKALLIRLFKIILLKDS